jgi:uncharacterized protein YbbK (DUF523 family)
LATYRETTIQTIDKREHHIGKTGGAMPLPTKKEIESLPAFTKERPMKILVSACLAGELCGVDGTSNGDAYWIKRLISLPNVKAVTFCPEHFSFGTPRNLPDIHGGNGFDVLDGKARVITDKGEDWTSGFLTAAREMLNLAKNNRIDLAILMDMSAACGSQVISDGCRVTPDRKYQKGPGVGAALLMRNGFRVVSQRDYRTLEHVHYKLDPSHPVAENTLDHHETDWYRTYFSVKE